jgi:hypothetical protein
MLRVNGEIVQQAIAVVVWFIEEHEIHRVFSSRNDMNATVEIEFYSKTEVSAHGQFR